MAGRDGRGPNGEGMMTGRGLGLCPGARAFRQDRFARGYRCRPGFNRGYGRGFRSVGFSPDESKVFLEQERDALKSRLKDLEEELENL